MPNTKSAAKRVRQSRKRHQRNQAAKSEIKTYIKRTRAAIAAGDFDEARRLARETESRLKKAAKTNVVHLNNANRRSARLHRAITAAQQAATEA